MQLLGRVAVAIAQAAYGYRLCSVSVRLSVCLYVCPVSGRKRLIWSGYRLGWWAWWAQVTASEMGVQIARVKGQFWGGPFL